MNQKTFRPARQGDGEQVGEVKSPWLRIGFALIKNPALDQTYSLSTYTIDANCNIVGMNYLTRNLEVR